MVSATTNRPDDDPTVAIQEDPGTHEVTVYLSMSTEYKRNYGYETYGTALSVAKANLEDLINVLKRTVVGRVCLKIRARSRNIC